MRHLWVVVVVAACKKQESPPPHPAPAAPVAKVAPDAGVQLVDLTRGVPVTITVSSQVKNPAILPRHIADGSLNTAWNSATGELAGSWIEVAVPAGAAIAELRMTVGHTGHGAKGEDYFTMNPRIKRVRVHQGDQLLGVFPLDIANRALQAIRIAGTGTVRIDVDEIVPGSKKGWRETCVSELEAWGAPPAGWTAPARPLVPTVEVYQPPVEAKPVSPCADLDARLAEHERQRKAEADQCAQLTGEGAQNCGLDSPGTPACSDETMQIEVGAPWRSKVGVVCQTTDVHYGEGACSLSVAAGDDGATVELTAGTPTLSIDALSATLQQVIPGGDPELVLSLTTSRDSAYLVVCKTSPVTCSAPLQVASTGWKLKTRFQNGSVVTEKLDGDPPADVLVTAPLFR